MELAHCHDISSSDRRGAQTSQLDYAEFDDHRILEVVNTATKEYGFCLNRIWATTRSLPGGISNLPNLLKPTDELKEVFSQEGEQKNHQFEKNLHKQCTLDFCEQSQINFTSISQRHESPSCKPGPPCESLKGLFPRDVLDEAVEKDQDRPTAWQLNGAAMIQDGQKYMAISHVWSDGTGAGAWDGLKINKCLYHFFRKIAREFGCEGIWWDTICVPGRKSLREKALAKMHVNYEKAEITFVHDCFLRNLPWINAETACIAILMSPWFSRGWTALELARSKKGSVKVAFKGAGRPLLKDLDDDILAKHGSSDRHQLASSLIEKLRGGHVQEVNDLLIVLGSRHTSWAKDMAVISALLVGANITGAEPQQDIYQAVLRKIKRLCHAHLFHDSPTISNGSSWLPISLLKMPLPSTNIEPTLHIGERGEVMGTWKIIQIENTRDWQYVWRDVHPLIAAKLRSCLKLEDDHVFLVEPCEEKVKRALLVKKLKEIGKTIRCQFVGSMYFDPPKQLDLGFDWEVTIVNAEETGTTAQDDCKENSKVEGRKGKVEDERNHLSSIKENGTRSIVQCNPQFQQTGTHIEAQAEIANEREGKDHQFSSETTSSATNVNEDLLEAAKNGNTNRVHQLILQRANIGFQDKDGRTPTSWAAEGGHYDVVELLLKQYEVDYDCMDNSSQISPLSTNTDAKKELHPVVRPTVRNFTSVYDLEDVEGRAPLLLALMGRHRNVALLLLGWYETQYEAKQNDVHDQTPLWWAAETGQEDIVRHLLETGKADINLKDKDGRTPLWWAVKKLSEEMVKLLIKSGKADVNLKDKDGRTPLWLAVEMGQECMVRVLVETGKVDIESKDNNGRTPLSWAAVTGREEMVRLLVGEFKANVESKDNKGRTPLSLAAVTKREGMIRLLVDEFKAKVESKDNTGRTPLSWAVATGYESMVGLLVEEFKADVKSKDKYGRTALGFPMDMLGGADPKGESVVRLLIEEFKADVESKDVYGRTPLAWAAETG